MDNVYCLFKKKKKFVSQKDLSVCLPCVSLYAVVICKCLQMASVTRHVAFFVLNQHFVQLWCLHDFAGWFGIAMSHCSRYWMSNKKKKGKVLNAVSTDSLEHTFWSFKYHDRWILFLTYWLVIFASHWVHWGKNIRLFLY